MKKLITIIVTALITATSFAQTDVRKVENFSELNIKNAFEVVLTKGDKTEVKITAENKEDIEKVISEVSNGKLNIYVKEKEKTKGTIKINITYKNLTGINQSGATELSATNTIKSSNFFIKGSGAAEVNLDFDVTNLDINFSGASEISLKGNTTNFALTLSGASELKASKLKSKSATIDISGAAEVNLYVSGSIEGKTSGASSIKVAGGASVNNIKKSGASSISKG